MNVSSLLATSQEIPVEGKNPKKYFLKRMEETGGKNIFPRDNLGRKFSSLRLSLTPYCNFSCNYCQPPALKNTSTRFEKKLFEKEKKFQKKFHSPEHFLAMVEKITSVTEIKKIRITGGEPLLYPHLADLIKHLAQKNIDDIALTTNGSLANEKKILELKAAGLKRINFSVDSLHPESFARITGSPQKHLQTVLHAIDFAKAQGLEVKVNVIVMADVNYNELVEMLFYFALRDIPLRFLELMQMGQSQEMYKKNFVSEKNILMALQKKFSFSRLQKENNSTATYFSLKDFVIAHSMEDDDISEKSIKKISGYRFGIIANYSHPFCFDCDRLRLDSEGNIFGCISSEKSYSIHSANNEQETARLLALALQEKRLVFSGSSISMAQLGG